MTREFEVTRLVVKSTYYTIHANTLETAKKNAKILIDKGWIQPDTEEETNEKITVREKSK